MTPWLLLMLWPLPVLVWLWRRVRFLEGYADRINVKQARDFATLHDLSDRERRNHKRGMELERANKYRAQDLSRQHADVSLHGCEILEIFYRLRALESCHWIEDRTDVVRHHDGDWVRAAWALAIEMGTGRPKDWEKQVGGFLERRRKQAERKARKRKGSDADETDATDGRDVAAGRDDGTGRDDRHPVDAAAEAGDDEGGESPGAEHDRRP